MEQITCLTPYAPVIQLIAGVYLIFFYQTVFDEKFLDGSIQKKLISNLNQVLRTGGEYISEKTFNSDIEKFYTWWERYTNSVKAVARMGGVYGITLLIYCGIEGFEKKLGLEAVLVDSIIYAVYALIVVFVARKGWLCNSKTWVLGAFIYGAIGYIFPPQDSIAFANGVWGLTLTQALQTIVWIAPLGIILAICRYQFDEWHYDHTNKCFNRTTKIQNDFSNIRMTIITTGNNMDKAMSMFYEEYGDLLEMQKWKYEKQNETRDRREWGEIFAIYYRDRYKYWVSPIHKKIIYQVIHSPRKICYWRAHFPCHFSMCVVLICLGIFCWLVSYFY
ncbi:MAG: hypothetical protein HDS67_03325 [Bacteroidales bacterium]|nr:hypothetical protein [Bacteroidales bacterium]